MDNITSSLLSKIPEAIRKPVAYALSGMTFGIVAAIVLSLVFLQKGKREIELCDFESANVTFSAMQDYLHTGLSVFPHIQYLEGVPLRYLAECKYRIAGKDPDNGYSKAFELATNATNLILRGPFSNSKDKEVIAARRIAASCLYNLNRLQEAKELIELNLRNDETQLKERVADLVLAANLALKRHDYNGAKTIFREILVIMPNALLPNHKQAQIYSNYATLLFDLSNYQKALEYDLKALENLKKEKGSKCADSLNAPIATNLGNDYWKLKNFAEAIREVKYAQSQLRGHPDWEALTTLDLATIYRDSGDIDRSKEQVSTCEDYFTSNHSSKEEKSSFYILKASLKRLENELTGAASDLQIAETNASTAQNNDKIMSELLIERSRLARAEGLIPKSKLLAQKAITRATSAYPNGSEHLTVKEYQHELDSIR